MNIKRNPISARDEVFCFIITMLFQRGIVIPSVRPSVCLLWYLLLNHWTKSNQVWCASYSYESGVQQHFFGHLPGAPGRVQRSTIIFEKSISKIFIEGDGEQNGIQVQCSPYGQTCDLEMESIGQLSLNFFESVGVQHPLTTHLRVLSFSKMLQNSEIVVQIAHLASLLHK